MKKTGISFFILLLSVLLHAQAAHTAANFYLIKASRIFDGENLRDNIWILVKDQVIQEVGAPQSFTIPSAAKIIDLKDKLLMPGLIEGHSHLFLHPYNETRWDDQVLNEPRAERTARAVNHAKATLMAGFTTVRDLGTEGAQYDDVGLKKAIEKGIIPGPRMIVATRAIVATGAYGPQPGVADQETIRGAAEADGESALIHEARLQIGKGADLVKVYADYRWGPDHEAQPTFTEDELKKLVIVVNSSGRMVVAHASTAEGMRRATLAGVGTIEHGDAGTVEVFSLMKDRGVAYCPTLAARKLWNPTGDGKKALIRNRQPSRIRKKVLRFPSSRALKSAWEAMWACLPMGKTGGKWSLWWNTV